LHIHSEFANTILAQPFKNFNCFSRFLKIFGVDLPEKRRFVCFFGK